MACEVTEPLLAVCGTPTYVAPEILMETGYGLKVNLMISELCYYRELMEVNGSCHKRQTLSKIH